MQSPFSRGDYCGFGIALPGDQGSPRRTRDSSQAPIFHSRSRVLFCQGTDAVDFNQCPATHLEGGKAAFIDQFVNLGPAKTERLDGIRNRDGDGFHDNLLGRNSFANVHDLGRTARLVWGD